MLDTKEAEIIQLQEETDMVSNSSNIMGEGVSS